MSHHIIKSCLWAVAAKGSCATCWAAPPPGPIMDALGFTQRLGWKGAGIAYGMPYAIAPGKPTVVGGAMAVAIV